MRFKHTVSFALTLAGAVVGAGIVTGAEVREYFAACGVFAPLAATVASAVIAAVLGYISLFCAGQNITSLQQLCNVLFVHTGNAVYRLFAASAVLVCAGMLSGLVQALSGAVPPIAVRLAVAGLGIAVAFCGDKGVMAAGGFIMPLIIVFLLFALPQSKAAEVQSGGIACVLRAVTVFPAYNTAMALPLCTGHGDRKNIGRAALLCGVFVYAVLLIVLFIGGSGELPVRNALKNNPLLLSCYTVCLAGAVLTTYFASLTAYKSKKGILLATGAAFALSYIPLSNIVRYLYPVCGILLVPLLYKTVRISRKKGLTKSAGGNILLSVSGGKLKSENMLLAADRRQNAMTLDKLPVGSGGRIKAVGGEGALRLRLLDMGLIPNTDVTVCKLAPLGDPIEIRLRGYELTLRKEDAALITLEDSL